MIIAAAAVVFLGLAGLTAKLVSDSNARSEQQATQAAAEQAERTEADRLAKAARDAAAAQDAKDSATRAARTRSVTGIEESIKTMSEEHVAKGIIDGPIIAVSCSPVSGGSTDDLTETTTVFSCFVSNKDNGDGTSSGYKYNSTMNWTTGSYTYGMGAP